MLITVEVVSTRLINVSAPQMEQKQTIKVDSE